VKAAWPASESSGTRWLSDEAAGESLQTPEIAQLYEMVFGMDDIRSKTVCLLGGLEGSRTRPRASRCKPPRSRSCTRWSSAWTTSGARRSTGRPRRLSDEAAGESLQTPEIAQLYEMVFGMDDIRSKTVCLLGGLEGSRPLGGGGGSRRGEARRRQRGLLRHARDRVLDPLSRALGRVPGRPAGVEARSRARIRRARKRRRGWTS
jgi:hypothetical protein